MKYNYQGKKKYSLNLHFWVKKTHIELLNNSKSSSESFLIAFHFK